MKFRTEEMTTTQKRELWSCLDNRGKQPVPTDEELDKKIYSLMQNNIRRSAVAWGYISRMLSPEIRQFLDRTPVLDWILIRKSEKMLLHQIVKNNKKMRVYHRCLRRLAGSMFPLYRGSTIMHMLFNLRKHGFITKLPLEKGKNNGHYMIMPLARRYVERNEIELRKMVIAHDPEKNHIDKPVGYKMNRTKHKPKL